MKKIIILIPVFNDWESLVKLINELNDNIKDYKNINFECIVVNDASTIIQPKLTKPNNINSLQILNMKENRGHARCNAFGIRYIFKNKSFDNLILMDGDGEDRPEEIKGLINKISNNPNNSVVAKRIKRSEGLFFQLLYQAHKIITYIFTGKNINFGNYSCLTKQDVEKLHSDRSLWSSYSGTVKKNLKKLSEVNSIRGLRYFGPSQMSFFKLLVHSFSIIGVFKYQVFLRSSFMLIILSYFNPYLGDFSILIQVLIVLFNLIIFIISLREKEKEFKNSHNNLFSITNITH
jgi:glycosyltransferase involved in cell wall biosynthesis|tara:strand:- start:38 stop:910 length:873 start_codon:yes stop_codon:yes gene_type:complete